MKKPIKRAICEKCGKEGSLIPEDATEVLCFKYNEAEMDKRDKLKAHK